ncbi:MAG: hypothetical protein RIQ54_126 [Candidatus Parcubacteria bacterium]|jgi:hypothetical protein
MNFTDNNTMQPADRFAITTPLLWLEKFLTSGISWGVLLFSLLFFFFFLLPIAGFGGLALAGAGSKSYSVFEFLFIVSGYSPLGFVWALSLPNLVFLLLFVLFRRTRLGVFFRDFLLTFLVLSVLFCCISFLSSLMY